MPGLPRTGASPAELLPPRPAALDPPLEPDDDHDLLVLDPRLSPQNRAEMRKRRSQRSRDEYCGALKMGGYAPLRAGACVAVSFPLLGVLEERSFLPLLPLHWLIEVGGLGVVPLLVLYPPSSRVYPPIAVVGGWLLRCRDHVKSTPRAQKGSAEPDPCGRRPYRDASTRRTSAEPE